MSIRFMVLGSLAMLGACGKSTPARSLDLDAIRISGKARMRTDVGGDGKFASTASFVLVDAENTAGEGAYVTLGGAFTDASGAAIGALKPQSLWVPAHESRTFALVDTERAPRPAATSARITVHGAVIPAEPPRADLRARLVRRPRQDRGAGLPGQHRRAPGPDHGDRLVGAALIRRGGQLEPDVLTRRSPGPQCAR